jgi:hypothetical protein
MTREATTTTSRPVLDEATFQHLLCAAHVMQQCNHCLAEADGKTAENVRIKSRTQEPLNIPVPDLRQEPPIPVEQADIEPGEPQNDSLIPPETDNLLSILASQLSSIGQQQVGTDPERTTTQAVAGVQEISGIEEQTPKRHAETTASDQPHSEPGEMPPPVQSAVPGEMSPQISLSNDFFGRSAMAFAKAAVLLLGASAYRLVSGPDRLALSSEAVQPRAPLGENNWCGAREGRCGTEPC